MPHASCSGEAGRSPSDSELSRLFSYCLPFDDGAAPNPFWGACTLAICKPAIRRVALPGDWVVGTGSANSPIGDISGRVVYAMLVTERLSMEEYDERTRVRLKKKVPNVNSHDPRWIVGDSLYDFSEPRVRQRIGVHEEGNQVTDLGGRNVLLSDHFVYFGDQPVLLPTKLQPIVKEGQGHKSSSNDRFLQPFVDWLETTGHKPCSLVGQPQMWHTVPAQSLPRACASARRDEAEAELAACDDRAGRWVQRGPKSGRPNVLQAYKAYRSTSVLHDRQRGEPSAGLTGRGIEGRGVTR